MINTVRCLFSRRKKFLLQTYILVVSRIMKFIVSYGFLYMKTANRNLPVLNLQLMSELVSGAGRAVRYCRDERVPNTGRTDRPARPPSCEPPASTRYIFPRSRAVLGMRDILVRIRMRTRILGSIPLTNGSGCGSGRPKNIRIRMRIRNTGTFISFFKKVKEVTK